MCVCVYMHVEVYISSRNDKNSGEIPRMRNNSQTQGYPEDESLGFAKPPRQKAENEAGQVAAFHGFQHRAPLSFVSGPCLLI